MTARHTLTAAILAFGLMFTGSQAAQANSTYSVEGGFAYPTQRVANNAMVESANDAALVMWHARGIYPDEHVTYLLVDNSTDPRRCGRASCGRPWRSSQRHHLAHRV